MKFLIYITLFISIQLSAQSYNWDWYQTIGSTGFDIISGISIAIDKNNNIYYTGSTEDTAFTDAYLIDYNGSFSAFLIKYDENGNYIWSKTFGGTSNENTYSITIDDNNNIFVTGRAAGLVTFDGINWESLTNCGQAYIVKFDENGNYLWHTIAESGNGEGNCLDIGSNNNIYYSGTTGASVSTFENQPLITGVSSSILAKYNDQNSFQWMKQIRSLYFPQLIYDNNFIYLFGYGLLGYNIIYNTDTIIPDFDNQRFIFKFDNSGNLIWYKRTYGISNSAISSNNNHFYIYGNFLDTIIFAPNDTLISAGSYNGFIASFDTSGNLEWAHVAESNRSFINSIDFDSQNNIWITGNYEQSLNIGQLNLIGSSDDRGLFFQINENGTVNNNNYFEWIMPTCQIYKHIIRLDSYENFIVNGIFTDCFEAGSFFENTTGNYDLFLIKLSLGGF